jgi:hypothetical protein
VNIPDLHPKFVKINSLTDLGTGAASVAVYDISEYRSKHGALLAALKMREMRAEARRAYAWQQLTSTPRLRWPTIKPRIRIARRAIKTSPKASPKRTRKANRSSCHGRTSEPDGSPRSLRHQSISENQSSAGQQCLALRFFERLFQ